MKLYLFDFDGTLIKKDSMIEFLKTLNKNILFYYIKNIIFIPIYLLFLLKILSRKTTKTIFLRIHLRNIKRDIIKIKSKEFSKNISNLFFPGVKELFESIKGEKCIVTASADFWMTDISEEMNCNLISSIVEFKNNKFNKISMNCYGKNKVQEILKNYKLSNFTEIHVYGNSKGDKQMLSLGTHKYYKFFK